MWRRLIFNKVAGWGKISTSHYWYIVVLLLYFYCSIAVQNPSFLHNLRSVHLLITGKFGNFHSANVISNSESCGDNLRKKPENQARQGPLLKDVEVDGFSNSI